MVLFLIKKVGKTLINSSISNSQPLDIYNKEVTAAVPSGAKLDRGDSEYIKVLKQAIVEVINENELVFLV